MSDEPSDAVPVLRTLLLLVCVGSLMVLTGWVVASQAWPLVPEGVPTRGAQVALGSALLLSCTVPPLFVAGRLIRWTASSGPHRPTVTLSTLGVYNGALLLASIWALPDAWRVQEPPDEVVAAEAPDPTGPMEAAEVFAESADGVVVVHTQVRVSEDDESMHGDIARITGRRVLDGHGSGFVVSADGLIVTNHHVIDGASHAAVALRSAERLPATVLVESPAHDLALLQVEIPGDVVLPLSTDPVAVGSSTFAIGAPMGLEYSLTEGIVSAVREMSGTRMLQMQTPVAPGSSGGPLLDDAGRVVGVNTAIAGPGMNLAVHVEHVHELLAAERSPRPLALAEEPSLRLLHLEVEGGEARPTERAGFDQLLTQMIQPWERCFEPDAAGGSVTLTLERRLQLSSDLPVSSEACLEDELKERWGFLSMVLRSLLPEDAALVASLGDSDGEVVQIRIERASSPGSPRAAR